MPLWAKEKPVDAVAYLYPQIGIEEGTASVALNKLFRIADADMQRAGIQDLMFELDDALMAEAKQHGAIDKRRLTSWLMQKVKSGVNLQVVGPEFARVTFREKDLDPSAVRSMGVEELQRHLNQLQALDVEIAYEGPERNLMFPAQGRLEARIMGEGQILPVRVPVQFTHEFNGKSTYRTLWFTVAYHLPVWVLKDVAKAKEPIKEKQLVRMIKGNNELLPDTCLEIPLGEKRYIADYQAGQVLSSGMIENIPAVDFGQNVRVAVEFGEVHIQTHGIARQAAEVGDEIAVESLSSGETFKAWVVDRGLVVVKDI